MSKIIKIRSCAACGHIKQLSGTWNNGGFICKILKQWLSKKESNVTKNALNYTINDMCPLLKRNK
jgi:hypothetical protein